MKPEYLEAIINEISNTEVLEAIVAACCTTLANSDAELILQLALIAMCAKRMHELNK